MSMTNWEALQDYQNRKVITLENRVQELEEALRSVLGVFKPHLHVPGAFMIFTADVRRAIQTINRALAGEERKNG
jgi:hypothetical protein